MKQILVPIDFSEITPAVIEIAKSIAYKTGYKIVLFHALDTHEIVDTSTKSPILSLPNWKFIHSEKGFEKKKQKLQEVLNKEIDILRGHCANCDYKIVELNPLEKASKKMLDYMQEIKPSFVIMGSHGIGSMIDYHIFGSNTKKILQKSNIPVLIAKNGVEWKEPKTILFVCDVLSPVSIKHFSLVAEVFKNFDVSFDLLHINTPSYFSTTVEVEGAFYEYKNNFKNLTIRSHIINDFTVVDGIKQFILTHPTDLLSLSILPDTLSYSFQEHTCEIFLRDSNLPIFVIPYLIE